MGIVVSLLCISLLVGICLAVSGAPQQPAKAPSVLSPNESRMTELTKLSQQIKKVADGNKKQMPDDDNDDDCAEPPPRRCRWWKTPNDGLVQANVVGPGQLPDDIAAHAPKWIPARTVHALPEDPATTADGGPCCICPQCGLSFFTPHDYWGHIPTCSVAPPSCVQTTLCLGNSHFDPDPRICMCRPGLAVSSSAVVGTGVGTGATSSSSSSSG